MSEHGVFATQLLPIDKLVSMPFQSRVSKVDPDFADLVASIQEYGMIEPVVARPLHDELSRYEVLAGERRLKAAKQLKWSVVPCHIREVTEDVAIVLQAEENLHRKDYDEEDKVHLVSELARLKGWDATEIAKRLHRSYSWAIKYLPDKYKDQEKAQAGMVGGIVKAATQRVAQEQTVKTQETRITIQCDRCKVNSGDCRLWHGHNLCGKDFAKAELNPEAYDGYFRYLEKGRQAVVEKPAKPQTPMQMTKYGDREGMMKVQHGAMEDKIVQKLRDKGFKVSTGKKIVVYQVTTEPDFNIELMGGKTVHGYVDYEFTHGSKQMDRDADLRDLLRKVEPDSFVVAVRVKGDSDKEADEKINEIEEALKF